MTLWNIMKLNDHTMFIVFDEKLLTYFAYIFHNL